MKSIPDENLYLQILEHSIQLFVVPPEKKNNVYYFNPIRSVKEAQFGEKALKRTT